MKEILKISCLLSFLFLFSVVHAQKNKDKKGDCPTYSENIKESLPVFEKPKFDTLSQNKVNADINLKDDSRSIDSVSLELKKFYENKEFGKGWRIQVWDGQNHIEMNQIISNYKLYYEELELPIYDTYDKTMFRVRIGDFTDRLEAFRSLQIIKKEFPNALLVPDTITLDKV